uniref:Small ribosomal subunit protein uS3c n=1 Tax=Callipsygma wilsonis TaxID=2320807 RepID=A0A386AZY3_9CHLO|nr:ribosomal protein S3 [Callipsygma wilsonis]AYC65005.1 ribosomal protein S3 [Callipsygma wilsonis]
MGQKVHPIGFRLGISRPYLSHWFASKKNYSEYLLEDTLLRQTLYQRYKYTGIERIEIFRKVETHLEIKIIAKKRNNLIGPKRKNLIFLKKEIKKIIASKKKVILSIFKTSSEKFISANSIIDFLVNLLEKRTPYRVVLNKFFKEKNLNSIEGLKIQISGRLNGAEIARKHWIRRGRLPLQTLQANIDYCFKKAQTIYGVLGIKVWVFQEKKKNVSTKKSKI